MEDFFLFEIRDVFIDCGKEQIEGEVEDTGERRNDQCSEVPELGKGGQAEVGRSYGSGWNERSMSLDVLWAWM